MRPEHIHLLACPTCKIDVSIVDTKEIEGVLIKTGQLGCSKCGKIYQISNFIPRFVSDNNYATGFGLEWNKHAKTQYDSHSGTNISEKRFFDETNWPRTMKGEKLLEVGCGSGRFTEQASSTQALVVSVDYSNAVDANYKSNGDKSNVLILQGDIYSLPVKVNYFDKIFCIGVLQHTPKPKEAFWELPKYLKAGGELVIDIYRKFYILKQILITKYWIRPLTKRMKPEVLYKLCKCYIQFMWPIVRIINRLPGGRKINKQLLIADYRGMFSLSEKMLKEWAILDTFDMLSPVYDYPQKLETVKEWFAKSKLRDVRVQYSYLGILGRGRKKEA